MEVKQEARNIGNAPSVQTHGPVPTEEVNFPLGNIDPALNQNKAPCRAPSPLTRNPI